jgi:glucosamine--fructose-6-phosphate aminotransferase (isomerizing)
VSLHSEIFEQPACLSRLLQTQRKTVTEVAAAIRRRNVPFAFLAARGSSDNAGRYANYLWGALNRLPMALATPSLFTYYARPPQLSGALVVGISQSGQSPDIVAVLEEGKRQGCLTLAITNAPESPLGRIAEFVLDIGTGPELAIAATKTYTAELMGLAMLSMAMLPAMADWAPLEHVPSWIDQCLQMEAQASAAANRFKEMQQCVVLGRGYNYATIFEWSLKLKELAYVEAEPFSSADFQHGPIAMVRTGFPVLGIVVGGSVASSMLPLVRQLRNELAAELVLISNLDEPLDLAQTQFRIAPEIPEFLTPMVGIVVGQMFAYHLALAKGLDPEEPRTISKVTETR